MAEQNPEVVRDLEARLQAYAKQQKKCHQHPENGCQWNHGHADRHRHQHDRDDAAYQVARAAEDIAALEAEIAAVAGMRAA